MSLYIRSKNALVETYKRISSDYVSAAKDLFSDIKSRPFKAFMYAGAFTSGVIAYKTVPTKENYISTVVECSNDLLLQADGTRNKDTDNYIQSILLHRAKDRLFYRNLGLFSIMYHNNHGNITKNYRAQCKYTNPRWIHFHNRVIDVGFLGRWWKINYMMTDYDIDFEELPKEFTNVFERYIDHLKRLFGYSYYNHLMAQPEKPKPFVYTKASDET